MVARLEVNLEVNPLYLHVFLHVLVLVSNVMPSNNMEFI